MFHSAGMLARDGRCKTLDSSSDGYVRGEGSAGLSQTISVVVCGTAVNQDGRSSSLTAPNGPAQQGVISRRNPNKRTSDETRACVPGHALLKQNSLLNVHKLCLHGRRPSACVPTLSTG